MKHLVALSGKGGTGKTSVVAALAMLAARDLDLVLVDADADAANLGLLLSPVETARLPFFGADVAVIDQDTCLHCGMCASVCRFGAIASDTAGRLVTHVDATACEGCGACLHECLAEAIRMESRQAGWQRRCETRYGPLFDGDLLPGQEASGKLVAALRRAASDEAKSRGADLILLDGPPGIGCPAIAASTGTDLALLVTEPSLSALHDLERVLGMLRHFSVPALAVLNKADLNEHVANDVRQFLAAEDVALVGEIPFADEVHAAIEEGRPLLADPGCALSNVFEAIWARTRRVLGALSPAGERRSATAP